MSISEDVGGACAEATCVRLHLGFKDISDH